MHETIVLDRIRTDGGTQPREYLNELVLSDYTEAMASGVEFPPLTLFYDGSHYWLADGFHRFFAAKKFGVETVVAEVQQGTRRDAILFAAGANAAHGLRRTNADKRRAVLTLLQDEEWQCWSNREIARQCGVTHTLVGKVRSELVDGHTGDATPPSSALETVPPPESFEGSGRLGMTGASLSQLYDDQSSLPPSAEEGEGRVHYAPLMYEDPQPSSGTGADDREMSAVPSLEVPRPHPSEHSDGEQKATLDELAASSRQTPAAWMAEMIVYWLLDLSKQYAGVTPSIVQQAAEQLVRQYDQAQNDISAVSADDVPFPASEVSLADEEAWGDRPSPGPFDS